MAYDTGLSMEERVTSLFQPDTLLPDQYLDTFRRKLQLEPEKKLMLAIIEDAVACFQKHVFARDSKGKSLFRDTEQWIFEKAGGEIFSFENVCETLRFDPNYLRRGLAQWKQQALAQRNQAQVYQLGPRRKKSRRGVSVSGRAANRMRRAVSR